MRISPQLAKCLANTIKSIQTKPHTNIRVGWYVSKKTRIKIAENTRAPVAKAPRAFCSAAALLGAFRPSANGPKAFDTVPGAKAPVP